MGHEILPRQTMHYEGMNPVITRHPGFGHKKFTSPSHNSLPTQNLQVIRSLSSQKEFTTKKRITKSWPSTKRKPPIQNYSQPTRNKAGTCTGLLISIGFFLLRPYYFNPCFWVGVPVCDWAAATEGLGFTVDDTTGCLRVFFKPIASRYGILLPRFG